MKKILILFLVPFFLNSCLEKSSGCLDPEAQNFAVEVDKSCDSCCLYPVLQVNIGAIWGDETTKFSYQKTWADATGRPFTIDTVAFYLSDFQLFNSATGDSAVIMDSLRMRVFPDSLGEFVRRNIALVRPTNETYNVGTLLAKGDFDRLRFKIGLSDAQNLVIPARAPSSFPLRPQPEDLWDETSKSFVFFKMRLKKDTFAATPLTTLEWPQSRGSVQVELDFTEKTSWKRGISPTILIVMDYQKWFADVDLAAPDAEILEKIWGNLKGSFVLKKP